MLQLRQLNVGAKLLTLSQLQVSLIQACVFLLFHIIPFIIIYHIHSLADFYTETITLPVAIASGPTRIECRAFVTGDDVPCCTYLTENILCQPDTGIARVVVDIVSESNSNAMWCKEGVDLNSVFPLDDKCPPNGEPQYCGRERSSNSNSTGGTSGTLTPATSSDPSVIASLMLTSP